MCTLFAPLRGGLSAGEKRGRGIARFLLVCVLKRETHFLRAICTFSFLMVFFLNHVATDSVYGDGARGRPSPRVSLSHTLSCTVAVKRASASRRCISCMMSPPVRAL